MPSVKLNKERVLTLAKLKATDKELKEIIPYLGTDLEEIDKDTIHVEIFPNRPDLLSDEGFAKALSSFTGKQTGLKKYEAKKSNYEVIVDKSVKDVRPCTACAVVKGLDLNEEKIDDIIEIQEKLHVTYGRNRKKCAIGIYPMEAIEFPITYKALKPKEIKFVPLGYRTPQIGKEIIETHEKGKEYAHLLKDAKVYPIFIDKNKEILSMPPIINSDLTGKVTKDTKEVFVECSGHDFKTLSKAINMIVTALADMGGTIYEVKVKYPKEIMKTTTTPELKSETMKLDLKYAQKIIGQKISGKEMMQSLEKMGFDAKTEKTNLIVQIPSYRTDILHPIDLVEDICIGYGYTNIKEINKRTYSLGRESKQEILKRKTREILSGLGLIETNNYSLYPKELLKEFSEEKNIVEISNPISKELESLRNSMMPCLLLNLKNNKQYEYPQKLFEIGTIYKKNKEEETGIKETENFAIAICSETADFTAAKQVLDAFMNAAGLKYESEKSKETHLIEGRSAKIMMNKKEIGVIGEIHPKILEMNQLEMPCACFEINFDLITEELSKNWTLKLINIQEILKIHAKNKTIHLRICRT